MDAQSLDPKDAVIKALEGELNMAKIALKAKNGALRDKDLLLDKALASEHTLRQHNNSLMAAQELQLDIIAELYKPDPPSTSLEVEIKKKGVHWQSSEFDIEDGQHEKTSWVMTVLDYGSGPIIVFLDCLHKGKIYATVKLEMLGQKREMSGLFSTINGTTVQLMHHDDFAEQTQGLTNFKARIEISIHIME